MGYDFGLLRALEVGATVVSIGNITAGGAGKTPATIYFARKYLEEGRRVAVLSRGYGRVTPMDGPRIVSDGIQVLLSLLSRGYGRVTPMDEPLVVSDGIQVLLSPREAGDEPYLMAQKLLGVPVVVCAKRTLAAELAIREFGAETLLLDDGFQHLPLARDEDIVVVDCANPFGYGRLLPRGLLREPMAALARATRFVLTRVDDADPSAIVETLRKMNPAAEILKSRHRPVRLTTLGDGAEESLDAIRGEKILAVSSIGNPAAFEATLGRLGADVAGSLRFADHHWYDEADVDRIQRKAKELGAAHIVTTEKDGVRLGLTSNAPKEALLLEVELEMVD
jgi:tetraacyldisaccharide 4'-kinase